MLAVHTKEPNRMYKPVSSKVDFPAPFNPTTAVIDPSMNWWEKDRIIFLPPMVTPIFSISSIGRLPFPMNENVEEKRSSHAGEKNTGRQLVRIEQNTGQQIGKDQKSSAPNAGKQQSVFDLSDSRHTE